MNKRIKIGSLWCGVRKRPSTRLRYRTPNASFIYLPPKSKHHGQKFESDSH